MESPADQATPPPGRGAETPTGAPRPVVWPWLVVPLITLVVFFVLRSLQQDAMRAPPADPPEPAEAQLRPAG